MLRDNINEPNRQEKTVMIIFVFEKLFSIESIELKDSLVITDEAE
jgi:hypothetical protein